MSNLRYLHNRHDNRTAAWQAAVLAVLFHALLLIAFRVTPGEVTTRNELNTHIRMVNVKAHDGSDSDLQAILYYSDPTAIAKPRYSYSLDENKGLVYEDDVQLDKPVTGFTPKVESFQEFKTECDTISKSVNVIGSYPTVYPFSDSVDGEVYPKVMDKSGALLEGILPQSVGREQDYTEKAPRKPTYYRVSKAGEAMIPRVVVVMSSGSIEYDMLGSKHIMRFFMNRDVDAAASKISILWQRAGGAQ